ncbi:hypothetical protein H5P36_19905 [Bacillus sp. APMAM]|nr:hypothetical protein [Bacillus sp. APMAM]RTZ54108.1 hypothetical protein EKO25_19685 [Bacillus sp. SAJ1]
MDISKKTNIMNKLNYVHKAGESIESHLRNSISIRQLMQHESDGLGHITIFQLLDVLQDLHITGQTEYYEVLKERNL